MIVAPRIDFKGGISQPAPWGVQPPASRFAMGLQGVGGATERKPPE